MRTQVLNGKRALWYPTKKDAGEPRKLVLFLPGFPKYPGMSKFAEMFLELGYDVLSPMYSGTFDSDGSFSIEKSVEDANFWHAYLQTGTFSVSPEEKESINVSETTLFSSSFGSLVAGLALKKYIFEAVSKCVFVSPLWDMSAYKLEEAQRNQADETSRLMDFSYPHSYRFADKEDFFKKLTGAIEIDGIDEDFLDEAKEFHIFAGNQDAITPPAMAAALNASYVSSQLYSLEGGHSSRIDIGAFKEIMTRVCSDRQE